MKQVFIIKRVQNGCTEYHEGGGTYSQRISEAITHDTYPEAESRLKELVYERSDIAYFQIEKYFTA